MVADRLIRIAYRLEDRGHEQFIPPLVRRMANEEAFNRGETLVFKEFSERIQSFPGLMSSHGNRVEKDLEQFLDDAQNYIDTDILVVCRDANSEGPHVRRKQLNEIVNAFPIAGSLHIVFALPDPYIGYWYLMDKVALAKALQIEQITLLIPKGKTERDFYKTLLKQICKEAGYSSNGIEYGKDIAAHLNINQMARNQPTFRSLLDDVRRSVCLLLQSKEHPPHQGEEQP
jgi:hypothetical protein